MPSPRHSSVTIDGKRFNTLSTKFGMTTVHDDFGIPMMGSQRITIDVTVDMHDTDNMRFDVLSTLFDLANIVTRDKIKQIQIAYWKDDLQDDALCVFRFEGWISNFMTLSGGGSNHTLLLSFQPKLAGSSFHDIQLGN